MSDKSSSGGDRGSGGRENHPSREEFSSALLLDRRQRVAGAADVVPVPSSAYVCMFTRLDFCRGGWKAMESEYSQFDERITLTLSLLAAP